jgi:SHS family sialic acid transporter-like MFS transporter
MAVIFVWSPVLKNVMPSTSNNVTLETALRSSITLIGLVVVLLGYIYPVVRYLRRAEAAVNLPGGSRTKYIGRMLLGACLSGVALLGT